MTDESTSTAIDAIFSDLDDWRGVMLSKIRALILQADPEVVEELKWKKPTNPAGVPAWSHNGMICTGEVYKEHVKVTFARGASLADPRGLFNASLGGNLRRAIDIREDDKLDGAVFKELVRAAVAQNARSLPALQHHGSESPH